MPRQAPNPPPLVKWLSSFQPYFPRGTVWWNVFRHRKMGRIVGDDNLRLRVVSCSQLLLFFRTVICTFIISEQHFSLALHIVCEYQPATSELSWSHMFRAALGVGGRGHDAKIEHSTFSGTNCLVLIPPPSADLLRPCRQIVTHRRFWSGNSLAPPHQIV